MGPEMCVFHKFLGGSEEYERKRARSLGLDGFLPAHQKTAALMTAAAGPRTAATQHTIQ